MAVELLLQWLLPLAEKQREPGVVSAGKDCHSSAVRVVGADCSAIHLSVSDTFMQKPAMLNSLAAMER